MMLIGMLGGVRTGRVQIREEIRRIEGGEKEIRRENVTLEEMEGRDGCERGRALRSFFLHDSYIA